MPVQPVYTGLERTLGGKSYVIPPLSLGQVRRFQGKLQEWSGAVDDKSIEVCVEVIHAAMSRNYPDLTLEAVADLIDLGNMVEMMQAVMDVSGLVRKAEEEKKALAGISTGTSSSVT